MIELLTVIFMLRSWRHTNNNRTVNSYRPAPFVTSHNLKKTKTHTAAATKRLLKRFRWGVFVHPPSSARTWFPVIFISSFVWNDHRRTTFWHNEPNECLNTHHHPPGLGSLWFSSLTSYETVVGGQYFDTMSCRPAQRRELAASTGGWLLCRGYWKVGTTLRKMSTSERRLCREVAGRCG